MKINNYTEFINESSYENNSQGRGDVIIGDNVEDILNKYAPWYLKNIKNITPIYRGFNINKYTNSEISIEDINYITIKPSLYNRKSANTNGLYMKLIDNSKYWKDYPKRRNSIICSTDVRKASGYGTLFRVIPLRENSNLCIAPSGDVFDSFEYMKKKSLEILGRKITSLPGLNYFLELDLDLDESDGYDTIKRTIEKYIKKNSTTLTFDDFDKSMSPELNGFDLIKYNSNIKIGNREVYTDEDCILIRQTELNKIL